jgi:ferredoxin
VANEGKPYRRKDLLEYPLVKRVVLNRNIQPLAQLANFTLFTFVIMTGLIGISLGAKNLSVVFTWILWSVLLALLLTPLMGRAWCFMCPVVWPGELIQRKLWSRFGTSFLQNRRWPAALKNVWLQNFIFLNFSIWMVVMVTQPFVTSIAVILLMAVATVFFVAYPRRRFCRHICPMGSFIGLYSSFSPVEVRVKNRDTCLIPPDKGGCHKECYEGSEKGYGCPWYEFPQHMVSDVDCGLCFECHKTCPLHNIDLNVRPFGVELESKEVKRKPDEAWRSLILLSLPVVYTAVLFGPWSWIKSWGDLLLYTSSVGLAQHLFYAILIIDIVLGMVPGLHYLASTGSKFLAGVKEVSVRTLFVEYSYAYIPMGLMLWMGFNFSLIMMEWSYIPVVASDPLGAGWNLLGTAHLYWLPIALPIPIVEIGFVLLGMWFSLKVGYSSLRRIFPEKRQAAAALIPFAVLTAAMAIVFLWFYV